MFCQTVNDYKDFNDWSRLNGQYTEMYQEVGTHSSFQKSNQASDIEGLSCETRCDDEKLYDANAEPQAEGRKKVRDEMWQMHMRSPAEALELALRKVIERDDATTSMA